MCVIVNDNNKKEIISEIKSLKNKITDSNLINLLNYTESCWNDTPLNILPDDIEISQNGNYINLVFSEKNGDKLVVQVKDTSTDKTHYCFNYEYKTRTRMANIFNANWLQITKLVNKWYDIHK